MASLPFDGETGWGDILNAYITALQNQTNTAQSSITNHAANNPADPHGDRSYALSLLTPVLTGANQPNGFVQLNSQGIIPSGLISGSLLNSFYDAVNVYGAAPNGSDASVPIQNALTAASNAGGGLVWVGPGVFSLANPLIIGSNTWLLLSQGTTLSRISGALTPSYLISNVKFGSSNNPASNIIISGGSLDAVGIQNLTSPCTPIFLIQSFNPVIGNMTINGVYNNPAIEINGCNSASVIDVFFQGTGSNSTQPTTPAIRVNVSNSATTPSGLVPAFYNNTVTKALQISGCRISDLPTGSTFGTYGNFANSDLVASGAPLSNQIMISNCSSRYAAINNVPVVTTSWSNYAVNNCLFFDNEASQSQPLVVYKSSSTTRGSTTVVNDPDLSLNLSANAVYLVRMVLMNCTGGTAGGIKYQFSTPASPGGSYTAQQYNLSAGFQSIDNKGWSGNNTADPDNGIIVDGTLIMGSSPGTLTFQWGQANNSGSTVVGKGSYLLAQQIA